MRAYRVYLVKEIEFDIVAESVEEVKEAIKDNDFDDWHTKWRIDSISDEEEATLSSIKGFSCSSSKVDLCCARYESIIDGEIFDTGLELAEFETKAKARADFRKSVQELFQEKLCFSKKE